MSEPSVTVVVATRDRPTPVMETLAGLRGQAFDPSRFEIVVVDDGSSKALPIAEADARVRLVRTSGVGRSAARNAGAATAGSALLVFLDDDMTVAPDFVVSHARAQQDWPGALAVGAIRLPERALATPFGRFRQRLEDAGVPTARGLVASGNACAAGNMSIPRAVFEGLGGFDPALASGEDQDLALRHTARGGRIAFLPEARAVHRDAALDIRRYCARVEWGSREVVAFCRRHPEWPDNRERERVNGPARWGREPAGDSSRKLAKAALATAPGRWALLGLAAVVEGLAPRSAVLERVYRLLLGVHVFRGFRRGLRAAQAP